MDSNSPMYITMQSEDDSPMANGYALYMQTG